METAVAAIARPIMKGGVESRVRDKCNAKIYGSSVAKFVSYLQ